MAPPTKSQQSFWTTLPGILTGLAGLLTAVGGVLAVVLNPGPSPPPRDVPHTAFVAQANQICQQYNAQNLPVYNTGDPPSVRLNALNTIVSAQLALDQRLRALSASAADQTNVTQMLQHWDQMANDMHQGALSLQQGNYAGEGQWVSASNGPNNQANDLATGLGLGNCASAQL
ncbi:MAG: hypothetical protein M3016_00575 [Actinomycetota bacterium]|nr:hypothetical protein [Actinomycetota bacterium]